MLSLLLSFLVPAIAHNEANGGESTCDICQEGMDEEEENEEDEYDLCMMNRESYAENLRII